MTMKLYNLCNDSSLPLLHLLSFSCCEPGQVLRLVLILNNLMIMMMMMTMMTMIPSYEPVEPG